MSERSLMTAAIERPIATTMIVVAISLFGYLSFNQMKLALMPQMTYPTLTVRAEYEGAAPEEVEQEVSTPLEEALRTTENLVEMGSISRAGRSDIQMEFRWGSDMDYLSQKVRERIDMVRLPDGVSRPQLLRYDPELDPVLRLGVVGVDSSLSQLRRYAEDELKRALEKVEGVAMVRVHGGEEPLLRIELDERRMSQLGVSPETVSNRLRQENVNLAGGQLDDGSIEYLVRTLSEFRGREEIEKLIVGQKGSVPIRLEDVAVSVERATREREVITRIGREESVEVEIFKEADANLVAVAQGVKKRLDGTGDGERKLKGLREEAPEGVTIAILSDPSIFIEAALNEVVETAIIGGVLAILILFLFLRSVYATGIIGVSIPLSVVTTFAVLYLLDVSLNIMSLGGLALGIGMLVDNAVVVLESIYRCREEGDPPKDAARRGVREVGGAVIASTLTTIAVFLPIVFVEGVAGQVFGDLAMAVVISLMASLAVAVFFLPMLAAREQTGSLTLNLKGLLSRTGTLELSGVAGMKREWRGVINRMREASWIKRLVLIPVELVLAPYRLIRGVLVVVLEQVAALSLRLVIVLASLLLGLVMAVGRGVGFVLRPVLAGFDTAMEGVRRGYAWLLERALNQRLTVLVLATGLGAWSVVLFQSIETELIPQVHSGELVIELSMPVGTPLLETADKVEGIESQVASFSEIESTSSFIGARSDANESSDEGEHSARLTLRLGPAEGGDMMAQEDRVVSELRKILEREAGLTYELRRPSLFSLKTPIQVELRGHDLNDLSRAAERTRAKLGTIEGLADLRSSLGRGFQEIHIQLDRDAMATRGLNARTVAETIRQKVLGEVPTALRTGERRLDIEVRLDRASLVDREALESLVIQPSQGEAPPVRLKSVAQFAIEEGPSEIRHIEGQRVVVIEGTTQGIELSEAVRRVQDALDTTRLPQDVSALVTGQNVEMETARKSLTMALLLAIFLVYIVMASRFEALAAPMVILLTIPLAGIGVVLSLYLTQTPLSIVVFIGVIMLAGIVVNNAIVLIDYVIQLRNRGLSRGEALRSACSIRLRPVLITTLTTVLGLLPMALELGEGAEIRAPMALAVMSGLGSSTVLTLVVVPVVYDLIGELGRGRFATRAEESVAISHD